jgi:hypothetical protein
MSDIIDSRRTMRRQVVLSFLGLLVCSAPLALAGTKYCFQNDALKLQPRVSFEIDGKKIEGTFESGGNEKNTSAETFDFTGTRAGQQLTIKFDGDPPYELPPGTKTIVWKLRNGVLEIPMFGNKYDDTERSTAYTVKFKRCKDN